MRICVFCQGDGKAGLRFLWLISDIVLEKNLGKCLAACHDERQFVMISNRWILRREKGIITHELRKAKLLAGNPSITESEAE